MQQENKVLVYEKQSLAEALELIKKRVEERVPIKDFFTQIISEVEKGRLDLERKTSDLKLQLKCLNDQLRESLRKNAKLQQQLTQTLKKDKDLEAEV